MTELICPESFLTPLMDVSPLLNLTQLEDLNLSFTRVDPEPVKQITWLKRLWRAGCPHDQEAIQQCGNHVPARILHRLGLVERPERL